MNSLPEPSNEETGVQETGTSSFDLDVLIKESELLGNEPEPEQPERRISAEVTFTIASDSDSSEDIFFNNVGTDDDGEENDRDNETRSKRRNATPPSKTKPKRAKTHDVFDEDTKKRRGSFSQELLTSRSRALTLHRGSCDRSVVQQAVEKFGQTPSQSNSRVTLSSVVPLDSDAAKPTPSELNVPPAPQRRTTRQRSASFALNSGASLQQFQSQLQQSQKQPQKQSVNQSMRKSFLALAPLMGQSQTHRISLLPEAEDEDDCKRSSVRGGQRGSSCRSSRREGSKSPSSPSTDGSSSGQSDSGSCSSGSSVSDDSGTGGSTGSDSSESDRRKRKRKQKTQGRQNSSFLYLQEDEANLDGPWIFSPWGNIIFGSLICINSVYIGLETDNYDRAPPQLWLFCEIFFLVAFSVEISQRFRYHAKMPLENFEVPKPFWQHPWNIFDTFLVFVGCVDTVFLSVILEGFSDDSDAQGATVVLSMLRMIRLFRLIRIFRIFRFLRELLMLVQGILDAMKALVWAMLLVIMVLYTCSIVMTKQIGQVNENTKLHEWFGSVGRSLLTLFQLMTLEEWSTVARTVMKEEPWCIVFFVAFVFITNWVLLNLVTGVILENVLTISRREEEKALQQEEARTQKTVYTIQNVLDEVLGDLQNDDQLTLKEFRRACRNPLVVKHLQSLQIAVYEAEELFILMDTQKKGSINIHSFIEGCLRIRGVARAKHLLAVQFDVQKVWSKLSDQLDEMEESIIAEIDASKSFDIEACEQKIKDATQSALLAVTKAASSTTHSIFNQVWDAQQKQNDQISKVFHLFQLQAHQSDGVVAAASTTTSPAAAGQLSQAGLIAQANLQLQPLSLTPSRPEQIRPRPQPADAAAGGGSSRVFPQNGAFAQQPEVEAGTIADVLDPLIVLTETQDQQMTFPASHFLVDPSEVSTISAMEDVLSYQRGQFGLETNVDDDIGIIGISRRSGGSPTTEVQPPIPPVPKSVGSSSSIQFPKSMGSSSSLLGRSSIKKNKVKGDFNDEGRSDHQRNSCGRSMTRTSSGQRHTEGKNPQKPSHGGKTPHFSSGSKHSVTEVQRTYSVNNLENAVDSPKLSKNAMVKSESVPVENPKSPKIGSKPDGTGIEDKHVRCLEDKHVRGLEDKHVRQHSRRHSDGTHGTHRKSNNEKRRRSIADGGPGGHFPNRPSWETKRVVGFEVAGDVVAEVFSGLQKNRVQIDNFLKRLDSCSKHQDELLSKLCRLLDLHNPLKEKEKEKKLPVITVSEADSESHKSPCGRTWDR